jgi:hypothetical protein
MPRKHPGSPSRKEITWLFQEMVIIRIKPILLGWKFEDLTLACKKCGSTKEFRIKRS